MNNNRNLRTLGIMLVSAATILVAGCGKSNDQSVMKPATTSVGTDIDDSVVTTRVKAALLGDADVKSFDLKVETRKGVVQLSGFVDNQGQVDRAVTVTRGVEGVKNIENSITLKVGTATIGSAVDDSVITTQVKAALLAEPAVKSADIAVVTRKGAVQLSGYVGTQAQIDEAIAVARKVNGVASVINEMSIKK
jgi:hyperosmotically inducible protein